MSRALFRSSKWIHKFFGLAVLIFAVWMSISGILLNHPEWIADISVPRWLVPPQYTPQNWNRSALIAAQWSDADPSTGWFAGKMGIWRTTDGGRSFAPMMQGLPTSAYYVKAYSLLLHKNRLWAGTEGGLYVCDPAIGVWRTVALGTEKVSVLKILRTRDHLLAFTGDGAWQAPVDAADRAAWRPVDIPRDPSTPHEVSWVKLFFDLHGGKAWGLPGQLLFDIAGIIIIVLSVTAFYIWFYPWKRKRAAKRPDAPKPENGGARRFHSWSRWHNTLGIWFAVILLLIGFTGIFMRPPLLAVIGEGGISTDLYPGLHRPGPWEEKIKNALYDGAAHEIVLATTEGFWRGPADFTAPFVQTDLETPVFVMGATVFEDQGATGYLIGSFSGIFRRTPGPNSSHDLLTGERATPRSSVRPAEVMVTGYLRTPEGEEFVTAHEQGLIPLNGAEAGDRFAMPEKLKSAADMSLWNLMFELHNGRIFADLIGDWYILIVPLGAIIFFLVCLSGVYDWFYVTLASRKKKTEDQQKAA